MSEISLPIVSSKEGIIKALFHSRMTRAMIGLRSSVLGPGTYFTSVKEITLKENDDVLVKLNGYDMTGYFLDQSELTLTDIEYVIPLNALFENPFTRGIGRESISKNDGDVPYALSGS